MAETASKSSDSAPGLGKSIGGFAHDMTLLAEMQARLLAVDARDSANRLITPAVLAVLGVAALLGCLPVFLLALAALFQALGLSTMLSLLVASAIGLALGGLLLILAWLFLRNALQPFLRSANAFHQNVAWLRSILKRQ